VALTPLSSRATTLSDSQRTLILQAVPRIPKHQELLFLQCQYHSLTPNPNICSPKVVLVSRNDAFHKTKTFPPISLPPALSSPSRKQERDLTIIKADKSPSLTPLELSKTLHIKPEPKQTTSGALSEKETRELWDEVFGSRKTFSSAESLSCPTLSTTSSPSPSEMPLPVFAQETCASILSDSYGITERDSETTRISKQWWQEKGTSWEKMTADSPNKPVTTLLDTDGSRQDRGRGYSETSSANNISELYKRTQSVGFQEVRHCF
jgi:hypothetical protein